MICEYCGVLIKTKAIHCPCCGAAITSSDDREEEFATAEEYYAKLQGQTSQAPTSQPSVTTARSGLDVVFVVLSFMMPVVGIFFGIRFLKNKQKPFGILCLVLGIIQTLSFVLPFIFEFGILFLTLFVELFNYTSGA